MTMDVGSQSAVLVKVAVGLMLVTGSALDTVRTGGEVATEAEDFETVTKVEAGVDVACSTLVGGAVDWVAGADVAGEVTAVELAPVSTAEDEPVTETEAEVTGFVGSSELVELTTGTLVIGPVGALVVPAGTLVGMLVGGLVTETGGSLLVELPTGTSELTLELEEIGGSVRGSEMLRPGVLEVDGGASEEVALPTSDADADAE